MKFRKKAQLQIPGAIVDIYAIIGFVLVLLVFILLFQIQGCTSRNEAKAEILSKAEGLDANLVLLNYLRSSLMIEEKENTVGELTALYLTAGKQEEHRKLLHSFLFNSFGIRGETIMHCIEYAGSDNCRTISGQENIVNISFALPDKKKTELVLWKSPDKSYAFCGNINNEEICESWSGCYYSDSECKPCYFVNSCSDYKSEDSCRIDFCRIGCNYQQGKCFKK